MRSAWRHRSLSEAVPIPRRSGRARFYHDIQLRGPVPSRLIHQPQGGFSPPRALMAAALEWARFPRPYPTSPLLKEEFHRLSWLRLLGAHDEGREPLHRLLVLWLQAHGQFTPAAWRPPLTASRVIELLRHVDIVFPGTDGPFREQVLDTLARQGRHLSRQLRAGREDRDMLLVRTARALAALCLPSDKGIGDVSADSLDLVLSRIAEGDVPERWRDLDVAVREIDDLMTLDSAFRARTLSPPSSLREAVKVGRLFLGGFYDPAGAPVLGTGQRLPDPQVVSRIGPVCRPEATSVLSGVGYGRLQADTSVLVADLGHGVDTAGAGGFSFSRSGIPIITHCGVPSRTARALIPAMKRWTEALRSAAASSTVDVVTTPPGIARYEDAEEGTLLRVDRGRGPARHVRRLFLSRDGLTLLGEEELPEARAVALRFHLPSGREVTLDEGDAVIHDRDQELARFRADRDSVGLEESVSALEDGTIRPALQLVVRPTRATSRWRLRVAVAI